MQYETNLLILVALVVAGFFLGKWHESRIRSIEARQQKARVIVPQYWFSLDEQRPSDGSLVLVLLNGATFPTLGVLKEGTWITISYGKAIKETTILFWMYIPEQPEVRK